MDIAVGNDWIPTLVPTEELARVNSHLKQLDILTEVLSPVLAGLLLSFASASGPMSGFLLVALRNVASFFPEILSLQRVFHRAPSLQALPSNLNNSSFGIMRKTIRGWRDFWTHPSALAMDKINEDRERPPKNF